MPTGVSKEEDFEPIEPFPTLTDEVKLKYPEREIAQLEAIEAHLTVMDLPARHPHLGLPRGSYRYNMSNDSYEAKRTRWLNLLNAEEEFGIAQDDYAELQNLESQMEKLALDTGRPTPRELKTARYGLAAAQGKEAAAVAWVRLTQKYPVESRSPANANARRQELNAIRRQVETAKSDYRMAHPLDEAGIAKFDHFAVRVEHEEAQAEFQAIPAATSRKDRKARTVEAADSLRRVEFLQSEIVRIGKLVSELESKQASNDKIAP